MAGLRVRVRWGKAVLELVFSGFGPSGAKGEGSWQLGGPDSRESTAGEGGGTSGGGGQWSAGSKADSE